MGIVLEMKILIEDIVSFVVCLGIECVFVVIEVDEDGNDVDCVNVFECLVENIYGCFECI